MDNTFYSAQSLSFKYLSLLLNLYNNNGERKKNWLLIFNEIDNIFCIFDLV